MMRLVLLLVGAAGILSGCATTGPPVPFQGSSGPVAWAVTDIGQIESLDGRRLRWSYVVRLTLAEETSVRFDAAIGLLMAEGTSVRFERRESSSYSGRDQTGGNAQSFPFARTLASGAPVNAPLATTWGWLREGAVFGGTSALGTLTVEHRFIGTDSQGKPVEVPVRLQLDRSVGKRVVAPPTVGPLPPERVVAETDLPGLTGLWRGSYRTDIGVNEFDVPLGALIRSDGRVDFSENDPVTNRFSGRLRVSAGKLELSQANDRGILALHEGEGRRVLFGTVTGRRGEASSSYRLRLESP